MDDNDHWWESWVDKPLWLDIVVFWLSCAVLVWLLVAQRVWREWRAERRAMRTPTETGDQPDVDARRR